MRRPLTELFCISPGTIYSSTKIDKIMKRPLLFFPFLLVGCVTTQSLPVEDRSRTYDLDNDLVFDATVQALNEQGFAINDAEKDEGIINTDYWSPRNRLVPFLPGTTRMKVSVLISEVPNGTQALINIDAIKEETLAIDGLLASTSSRKMSPDAARRYYQEFFDSLEDYLLLADQAPGR